MSVHILVLIDQTHSDNESCYMSSGIMFCRTFREICFEVSLTILLQQPYYLLSFLFSSVLSLKVLLNQ